MQVSSARALLEPVVREGRGRGEVGREISCDVTRGVCEWGGLSNEMTSVTSVMIGRLKILVEHSIESKNRL